ncbi:MAG: right-handed parallel beta-helix repeat-containing protein [Verrucomicrobia bacterium]|nr:right-handed parallel beta-helix repeat-containing protein [Verrucomicrobiota bacterium]
MKFSAKQGCFGWRLLAAWIALPSILSAGETGYLSHPPMRPLPTASQRPLEKGPAFFVDAAKGEDKQDGSESKPWKTINYAAKKLKPGDTLYLRGGIYREHLAIEKTGAPDRPIIIRGYPGELAILDGGLREFFENPATAWEPTTDGAKGEFRSTRAYPDLRSTESNHAHVHGNFGDSMAPLHGYRNLVDLRSDNEFWTITNKMDAETGVACGPGLWYDPASESIHIRLAHTNWPFLEPAHQYRGETDPRKLPLIISGGLDGNRVQIKNCRHLHLQDLVIRGCHPVAIEVSQSKDLSLDRLTVYGCHHPINITTTRNLKIQDCAFRGIAGPWSSRSHLKYRGVEGGLFTAYGAEGNADFEISYSEFTDSCDGLFMGQIKNCKFHHNYVDNCSDDGFNLSANWTPEENTAYGNIQIYQNLLSRCLTMFAFGGKREGNKARTGSGVYIFRNVIDQRAPVFSGPSKDKEGIAEAMRYRGQMMGDHGHGLWEPVLFYQNTLLSQFGSERGIYGLGTVRHCGSQWRVLNNLFVQIEKPLATTIFNTGDGPDFLTDYNLHWSFQEGAEISDDEFINQVQIEARRQARADGRSEVSVENCAKWAVHDLVADPKFEKSPLDWRQPPAVHLKAGSPAIDRGGEIPREWPDPLRGQDKNKPDTGVVPFGCEPWKVGMYGRLSVFGEGN